MSSSNSRREFMKNTGALGLGLVTLPSLVNNAGRERPVEKKKIVCVGGHPDDPESGCGGTLAKLRNAGHEVTIIYLTTGEAGIPGKSHDEAAAIRKQEAINACKVLDAKPVFAGQIDGDSVVNNDWVNRIHQLIMDEKAGHRFHSLAGRFTQRPPVGKPAHHSKLAAGATTIFPLLL